MPNDVGSWVTRIAAQARTFGKWSLAARIKPEFREEAAHYVSTRCDLDTCTPDQIVKALEIFEKVNAVAFCTASDVREAEEVASRTVSVAAPSKPPTKDELLTWTAEQRLNFANGGAPPHPALIPKPYKKPL